jgi:succinoglycan biosynthesis transport protein ExoP
MTPTQLLTILWRRIWTVLIVSVSTMIAAGLLLYVVPSRYDAQATATVDPSQSDPVTGQAVGSSGLRVLQGNMVALAKSQRVAQDVVRRLNLTSNPLLMARYRASDSVGRVDAVDWIASELLRSLDVRFNEGTNVIVIIFKGPNPLLASQVANTFMAAFADAAIESKVSGALQTAQWFEPQTDKLRQEVEEARQKVSRFQIAQKLGPTGQGDTEVSALQQVSNDLTSVKSDILRVRTELSLNPETALGDTSAQPFDSALMQSLKNNLASTISEIGRLQSSVGPNNPRLAALFATQRTLQEQINAERKEIRAALERRLVNLQTQAASFEKARAEQLTNVISIQEQRDQLTLLTRDLEVKQERYVAAMRTSAAARLQGQLSFSNISILDKAVVPVSPSFPKPMLVIPAAIAAGLGLGIILALITEAVDRKIRVPRDLEFATLAPMLGVVLSAGGNSSGKRFRKIGRSALPYPP